MRAPAFWSDPPERPSWPVRLLWPASQLWRLGSWVRAHRTVAWRAPVPVICIGNLTAGGTGKTPLVAALLPRLCTAGLSPHVLSRGYGGRLHGPHRV
ncbi:MAG: tetraacyldisaccharide 4'-kinase, partial [Pseudomonadota bacterium]